MSPTETKLDQIEKILADAKNAFDTFRNSSGKERAQLLNKVVSELESKKDEIIALAVEESNLPVPRITGEFGRTIGQLKAFANYVDEGSWVEARIDTAMPDRQPLPKPDIRKMLVPIGPVVVFGASNFPLAFSTAGGDTASALAAGCPVIVKGHPAHPKTSKFVADCIASAVSSVGLPAGVFSHVQGGIDVGTALVSHPITKAVGFTGSFVGGKALFDLANKRKEPIPVYAEMGSTNPVFLLPSAIKNRCKDIATMYAGSITLSVGQFCTNPGMLLGISGNELNAFKTELAEQMKQIAPGQMLHEGIAKTYNKNLELAIKQGGVEVLAESMTAASDGQGRPTLASVSFDDFVGNEILSEEIFGPYSLLIEGKDMNELAAALDELPGQLTATVIGDDEDLRNYADFIGKLREKVGRVIINGVPTGVEVCPSMHHGGPYPSTTNAHFTSVGTDAIKRFVRPVSFQNYPEYLLPQELHNANPLGITRLVNGSYTTEAI